MFDSNQNNANGAYQYAPQNGPAQIRQPSVLTREEFDRLNKQSNPFNITLTEEEVLRGICNHRTPDGTADTLVQQSDGSFRCTTCGWEFNPIDASASDEDIRSAVDAVIDILQTIKLLYIEMPISAQREYFQIIPLLNKAPELFKLAAANFAKYENDGNWAYRGANMNAMSLFNTLTGALNQQPYYYGAPQQQYYGQPQPQPQYYNQNANYGAPQQPYYGAPQQSVNPQQPVGSAPPTNGFGYNGPQPAYQPQQNGFQYNPQAPYQPTPAPEQPGVQNPTDTKSETDGQTVSTTATFKA